VGALAALITSTLLVLRFVNILVAGIWRKTHDESPPFGACGPEIIGPEEDQARSPATRASLWRCALRPRLVLQEN